MRKFEYKLIRPAFTSANEQEEYLNGMGQEGWQLVHFSGQLVLMREIQSVKRWYRFKHRTTGHYLAATGNSTTSDINRVWFSIDRALLVGVEGMYHDFEIVESEA